MMLDLRLSPQQSRIVSAVLEREVLGELERREELVIDDGEHRWGSWSRSLLVGIGIGADRCAQNEQALSGGGQQLKAGRMT